jgi:hypothetical protein
MKFTRLKHWPSDRRGWQNKPLLCLLNLHVIRDHPSDHTWKVCTRCEGERW